MADTWSSDTLLQETTAAGAGSAEAEVCEAGRFHETTHMFFPQCKRTVTWQRPHLLGSLSMLAVQTQRLGLAHAILQDPAGWVKQRVTVRQTTVQQMQQDY